MQNVFAVPALQQKPRAGMSGKGPFTTVMILTGGMVSDLHRTGKF